ncbi:MAG: GlsB/YeaQ/YmgE family stress response membrane protein [Pseudomonadota bacterium]|nr:GlsB/YeaQ/YmgE family stress response membrane protein [Pseudomonadota bacterium]
MELINLVVFLVIGLISGLLAGLILRGTGLSLACDVGAGLVGGVLGGILMMTFGVAGQSEYLAYAAAAVGATVVIMLAGPIKRHL